MAGARSAGRMPFMSASPLNRRSAALYGAELTQPGYQQRIAESLFWLPRNGKDRAYHQNSACYQEGKEVMAVTVAVTGLLAAVPPGQRTPRVRSRKRPGG